MTWLGVDLGDARVGLALSDPELTFAHPYGNIQAYGDSFHTLDDVITVVEDECVEHIVVGLPLLLDGTEGKSAKKARRWCANLAKRMQALAEEGDFALARVPSVAMQDERLTTVTAHLQLLEANLGFRRHRPVVDQQSAVMILQSALDSALESEKYREDAAK